MEVSYHNTHHAMHNNTHQDTARFDRPQPKPSTVAAATLQQLPPSIGDKGPALAAVRVAVL